MHKKSKRLLIFQLVICFILSQVLLPSAASAESSRYKRLYGEDRYKTAVEISKEGWEESRYVVIARGDDFADALCAGPLASKYAAPYF